MGFVLKKFVSFWLMPLPLVLLLLVAGLWLTGRDRRSRLGRRLLIAAALVLLLLGNGFVSTQLVLPLERAYPSIPDIRPGEPVPARLAACRFVVVLGSGQADDPTLSANNRLSPAGLARITEGVRMLRLLPTARLIVSGPSVGNRPTHASVLAASAAALGVDPARITQVDSAHDTAEESQVVGALVGSAPIALVTSAAHMPRAAALFRRAGVAVLPCPTDFLAKTNAEFRWTDLLWDPESLLRSTSAIHERLGSAVLRLQGKVD
jgi:uncharacterized SAM-binding protein YcdF (DUF218 family)